MNFTPDRDDHTEIDELLRAAVRCALDTPDFKAALDRYRKLLPEVAPRLVAQMPPDEEAQRALAFATFRAVWNVLPRPDHDWRPRPLPKPERNGPCPCGSGRKHKQCCGPLSDASPFGGEGFTVLAYVLERVPLSQYKDLPFKKLSPEELGHVASEWLEQGRHGEAIALLEPLLADPGRLDARHEYAFDMLCDAYLELDRPIERRRLVEGLMQCKDPELKSAAMHRRCTMLADEGNHPAAWKLFKEAQRVDPDNPSLAHLEVVLLISRDEIAQAQERARFWAARLRKLGYEGERIVDLMEDIARDPRAFAEAFRKGFTDGEETDDQALDTLAGLVEALPAPACHFRLQPQDGDAGRLEPDAKLAKTEAQWHAVFENDEDPWDDTGWIDWLAGHPLAWQSFAILEDVVAALADVLFAEEQEALLNVMEEDLLEHALALLRVNIAENGAEACALAWGWLENRPALRLIGQAIDLEMGTEAELPLLEWLVLTLNPNDNQGFRERLVHVYAANGRAADAVAVYERYPDDILGAMHYGRVLALYLAGRRGEAVAALAQAKKRAPRILKTLTAAKPRMPELQPGLMSPGGEDEAWYYRQNWHGVWEQTGALAWLRQAAGK